MMKKIAIIGAGITGITLAHKLQKTCEVIIFDKSRGVGGRMATRRADPYQFDHGAQFFSAHSDEFKEFLKPLISQKIVTPWQATFAEVDHNGIIEQRQWHNDSPHFVANPGMNALAKFLSKDLHISLNSQISHLEYDQKWCLITVNNEKFTGFDWVIVTAPAEQAARILPTDFEHSNAIKKIKMQACFSLMLGFDEPLTLPFDAARIHNADISWLSVNSSKPYRGTPYSLLIHSTNQWAEQHIDNNNDDMQTHLHQATSRILKLPLDHAKHKAIHAWRYANIGKQTSPAFYLDQPRQLIACGDWCIQGRVEAAFTSATLAADKLLALLKK